MFALMNQAKLYSEHEYNLGLKKHESQGILSILAYDRRCGRIHNAFGYRETKMELG